jgi:hypothetical protein
MPLLPFDHHGGLFVKAPAESVADCLVRWGNEDKVSRSTRATRKRLPYEQALDLLTPRQWSPDRAIVVPLAGGWTAFFDNHSHEYTPTAEQFILGERLNTPACWFYYDDKADSPFRGSAQFILERFGSPAQSRTLDVGNEEGRWHFQGSGDRLPFERADLYALPRKRDRLPLNVLRGYGQALGIPFSDAGAYGSDIVYLSWGEKRPADPTSTLVKLLRLFGRQK